MADSTPPPDAGADAGAKALLGLAAGPITNSHPPPLPPISHPAPEPPPLQIPSQSTPATLLPSAPTLSLPPSQPPLLPTSLPPAQHLQQQPTFPQTQTTRQDLPPLGDWAPPEHSFRSIIPPTTSYDSLRTPRLNPLSQPTNAPPSTSSLVPPWDPTRPSQIPTSLPSVHPDFALPAPSAHWPPPPHPIPYTYPHPHHPHPASYYYYHGLPSHDPNARATNPPPQIPPPPVPGQPILPSSHYALPAVHHPSLISTIPSRLDLPLPMRSAAVPEPVSALDACVPSVHDIPRLRDTLPSLAVDKFSAMQKEDEMAPRDVGVDRVEGKVGDVEDGFRKGAQVARVELKEQEGLDGKKGAEVKVASPRKRRGRGIADLMNPTDTLPGERDETEVTRGEGKETKVKPEKEEAKMEDVETGGKGDSGRGCDVSADAVEEQEVGKVEIVAEKGEDGETVEEDTMDMGKGKVPHAKSEEKASNAVKEREEENDRIIEDDEREENGPEIVDDLLEEEEDDDDGESEETRCPCGSTENSGVMIACDDCNTWQHAKCMGYGGKVKVPDLYYCDMCRPEEILPGSLAHRKHKERMQARDKDGRDGKRETEVLLSSVKPLELRRHFAADLRQKKTGRKLSKGDVFNRYANLLRCHFVKYKHSVVEGLVIVLDMHRGEVVDKLDTALKRLRGHTGDKSKEDAQSKRRNGADSAPGDGLHGEATGIRSNGHGRSNPQKRARPASVSMDGDKASHHGDPNNSGELMAMAAAAGVELSSGRGLSREDRKLQQAMKLFARMEERERERKRPRIGESGTSPRVGHANRLKNSKHGPHAPSPSPKSSNSNVHNDLDELVGSGRVEEMLAKEEDGKKPLLQRHQHKQQQQQQQQQSSAPQQHNVTKEQPQKQTKKGSTASATGSEVDHDHGRKERDSKSREKADKASDRKKDSSLEAPAAGSNNRRRSILDRGRPNSDSKKRRGSAGTKDTDKKSGQAKTEVRQDPALKFKAFLPGPSVLGSRLVPQERLSASERERIASELESSKDKMRDRGMGFSQKEYRRVVAQEFAYQNQWRKESPTRKRYRSIEVALSSLEFNKQEATSKSAKPPELTEKKSPTFSVSMVVVSEKQKLPDKGQSLESRLMLPNSKDSEGHPPQSRNPIFSNASCVKKRPSMRDSPAGIAMPKVDTPKEGKGQELTDGKKQNQAARSAPAKITVPVMAKPSTPAHYGSPMLRSSPARPPTGLRSASPTLTKAARAPSPTPSPRIRRPSAAGRSPSASPERMRKNDDPSREKSANASTSELDSMLSQATGRVGGSNGTASESPISAPALQIPAVPHSKPIHIRSVPSTSVAGMANSSCSPVDAGKPKPASNGLGLRSLRSVPVSGAMDLANHTNGVRSQKSPMKGSPKVASPLSSPRKNEFSSGTAISDIFQQRLQGFLKPNANLSPSPITSRDGLKVPTATSSRLPNGTSKIRGNTNGVVGRAGNGLPSGTLPSFHSKTVENSNQWRPGLAKRTPTAHPSVKGPPPSGLSGPTGQNANGPPLFLNDKPRFRNGRVETGGRSDEDGRGNGSVPWNYNGRGSWASGSARGQKPSSESAAKTNRRERN